MLTILQMDIGSYQEAAEVWKMFAAVGADKISREEITQLEDSVLDKVAAVFNAPHQRKTKQHDEL